ncbi:hypothetical protein KJ781_03805, partial [Patescibacteria group bacterium]|nr:hypothetical protein [Patescibacteria group bacterium]MBU1448963.1 hypothetical protein [Patescibacteria group bacterium]
LIDETLMRDMDWIRDVVTRGLDLRATAKLPVRQALASLTVRLRDAAEAERLTNRAELLTLIRDELNVEKVVLEDGTDGLQEADAWVASLDTVITPELKRKGLGRELVRHLKNLRKTAGLQPNDRIMAAISTDDATLRETLESMKGPVANEVKADTLEVGTKKPKGMESTSNIELGGISVVVGLKRS